MPKLKRCLKKDRLSQLKALLEIIASEIDLQPGARDLGQLVKQYRETLKEIEEIEGTAGNNDEIANILQRREDNGNAGAVR